MKDLSKNFKFQGAGRRGEGGNKPKTTSTINKMQKNISMECIPRFLKWYQG
jgi:hypothetical protein